MVARIGPHSDVTSLTNPSSVPVSNALSADLLIIHEAAPPRPPPAVPPKQEEVAKRPKAFRRISDNKQPSKTVLGGAGFEIHALPTGHPKEVADEAFYGPQGDWCFSRR